MLFRSRAVEVGVKKATGVPIEIASVDVGVFTSKVDVRGIVLKNPADFPEPNFAELPQLYVDYRLPSIIVRRNHVNELFIHIDHLYLVKNNKGASNVTKIQESVAGGDKQTSAKYQLDRLRIHLGKVTIKDYSRAKPTERTLTLNLDRTYENISDSTDITRLVLMSLAGTVPLPDFGINTTDLKRNLSNATSTAVETIEKTGKGLFDSIKKSLPQK